MDADLDTLCIAVYCTADDLLPEPPGNARRMVTDAEVVTLCVAQAIMGIPQRPALPQGCSASAWALFPRLPAQPGYFKRRRRLADTIEWLMSVFASQSPGYHDDLLLIDSTPVECARSRETVKRSPLADAADYGYCASHSRYFWGFRLHAIFAPGRHPARAHAGLAQTRRARGRTRTARPLPPRTAAKHCSATRATPAASSPKPSATSTPRSSGPAAKTSPATDPTSPRSGNGSSRSSGPAKTCSPSNATAPAPSTASENASSNASSASPPASPSTTNSAAPAAHSSTTSPEPVESTI